VAGTVRRDLATAGCGALVAVAACWPDRVAIAGAVVVLGLAGAGAALLGHRVGRRRIATGGRPRTLAGAAAFAVIAFAVSWVCCRIGLELNTFMAVAVSLFVAATTTTAQLLAPPPVDYLLITPWVALLLHVARQLSTDDALRWLAAAVFG